jgi:hypothetical protein
MPTTTVAFSGGTVGVAGYGDRWQIAFGGSFTIGDKWGIEVGALTNFDIGSINFFPANTLPLFGATIAKRLYIGESNQVNFSDNGPPVNGQGGVLGWSQQNKGAGEIQFLTNFGGNDVIKALSQLQGRLVIVGRRSVQIWTVDADPANFALVQEMDNIGTNATLAHQNLGDFDVIILDDTGWRSLRTREVTLNAYVDDVGTPVDQLVQADLAAVGASGAVSIVDPTTKNFWGYLNGKIYILSRHPGSKIQAWSTYTPSFQANQGSVGGGGSFNGGGFLTVSGLTAGQPYNVVFGNATSCNYGGTSPATASGEITPVGTTLIFSGPPSAAWTGSVQGPTTFTPIKFVIYNGVIYCRSSERYHITYNSNSYDGSIMTVQTPWLDHKSPARIKTSSGIDAAFSGSWLIKASMDPKNQIFETVIAQGSSTTPIMTSDSTFDAQRYEFNAEGTHLGILARTTANLQAIARFAALIWHYEPGNQK